MVQYLCNRCGYSTNHRGCFINHLKRKNVCPSLQEDVSIESITKQYNIELYSKNDSKMIPFDSKNIPKYSKMIPFDSKMIPFDSKINFKANNQCKYCAKTYSTQSNLTKHLKTCKKKKETQLIEDKKYEEMKKAYEELKNQVEDMLIESSKAIAVTNTHNTHNTHNTNTINTNNTNNIKNTTNIHINNYGFENVKYLKKNYLNNLVHGVFTAIPRLIKKIHFNDKHPENQNIKITNKKEPYIRVRQNNEWLLKNKKEILEDLIDCKYMILSQHCDDFEEELPNGDVEKMNDFRKRYNGEEKNLMKELLEQAELALLNYSKK